MVTAGHLSQAPGVTAADEQAEWEVFVAQELLARCPAVPAWRPWTASSSLAA